MNTRTINPAVLRFNSDPGQPGSGSVSACNLGPVLAGLLGGCTQEGNRLKSIFRVSVVQTGWAESDGMPDVLGRYQVLEDEVRFTPRFPFEKGVPYRASFDPGQLGAAGFADVLTLEFLLPNEPKGVPAMIEEVFPSSDTLPENLLRFYVRFSRSMQRGRAAEQIVILGPDGFPAPDVLYRAPVELWDRSMRLLTILLDPGRLKRGVGPNAMLGPPLAAGKEYTLVIGAGMLNSTGRPLRESHSKRFLVTEAIREAVVVEQWEVARPPAGTRQPLLLTFPRSLDRVLLGQMIAIETAGGMAIGGEEIIDHGERRWSFTPTLPWAAGSYHVRVATGLEDVCGNGVIAAFERPLRPGSKPAGEAADRNLAFRLG